MPALGEACQGGVGEAEVREDPPVNQPGAASVGSWGESQAWARAVSVPVIIGFGLLAEP